MALRVKMGQTSMVEAIAKTADGKFYIAKKEVKVTVGGCGGWSETERYGERHGRSNENPRPDEGR
ncbi:MAG: hypothetical protein M5R42_08355 [Rhodocyclaceae bacterium]|nr:hypothetical protein [Rhodocyclaceae bacterium]